MKKSLILMLLSLIFTACQTEDNTQENYSNLERTFEFKELTNSPIGVEKNGKLELNVSNDKIMATFKNFNEKLNLGLKPKSFDLIKIEGKNYLRFYSEDNMVSTIALSRDKDNNYVTESTVCTSIACASGGGCIPDGVYCTKCTTNGGLSGDCKRTTTGFEHA